MLNNWIDDKYDWKKEIVLVTGGAGGIGGQVVKLFAERGTKVIVLDVIPMTFEAGMYPQLHPISIKPSLKSNNLYYRITSITNHHN